MTNIRNALMQAAGSASGDPVYVEDVFSTHLFTGTQSTLAINNGIDLDDKGGLVWFKARNNARNHALFDTERGNNLLYSNTTAAQSATTTAVTATNSNGFTVGSDTQVNKSGETIVAWTFAKQEGFFDIVKFSTTGGGGTQAVSHSLGSIPGFIIIKKTSAAQSWFTFHKSVTSPNSNWWRNWSTLTTAAFDDYFSDDSVINSAPTATAVTLGSYFTDQTADFVMYVFAEGGSDDQIFGDDGDEAIIKCGTFTTDGSSDAALQNIGFEPQWLLTKSTSTVDWYIPDAMRGLSVNSSVYLIPNSSSAETVSSIPVWIPHAQGFSINSLGNAGDTHIYIAIRRGPMKEPSAGTDVFAVDKANTGTMPPIYHSNFPVDLQMEYNSGESQAYRTKDTYSRLGGHYLEMNTTDAALTSASSYVSRFAYMNGATDGTSTIATKFSYMWRRYPKVFDLVIYEGNGSNSPFRTITHNLGVAPELVIIKNIDQALHWGVNQNTGDSDVDADVVYLNLNGAYSGGSGLTASATTVTLEGFGGTGQINNSGDTHLMLMFASLTGISKVGVYTGTGNDLNVTDLGAAARFVLIKRTDATGDWYVFDSLRGIVAGNEDTFLLNTDDALISGNDYIDPHSSGFTITSSAPDALNGNGGKYLYLAFS